MPACRRLPAIAVAKQFLCASACVPSDGSASRPVGPHGSSPELSRTLHQAFYIVVILPEAQPVDMIYIVGIVVVTYMVDMESKPSTSMPSRSVSAKPIGPAICVMPRFATPTLLLRSAEEPDTSGSSMKSNHPKRTTLCFASVHLPVGWMRWPLCVPLPSRRAKPKIIGLAGLETSVLLGWVQSPLLVHIQIGNGSRTVFV